MTRGQIAIDLTEPQVQILNLMSQGMSFNDIAKAVGCSVSAVGASMYRAYRKLGAKSPAHAVRIGFELGLLSGARTDLLRAELGRLYKALAVANTELVSQHEQVASSHAFGDHLLKSVA